jgi:hypothetical protein
MDTIGDNRPALITTDQLAMDYGHHETDVVAIELLLAGLPPVIDDDATSGVWNDKIKDLIVPKLKALESEREATKRPYIIAERTVDGYFQTLKARVTAAHGQIAGVVGSYLTRKRDAEQARLREEARQRAALADRERQEAAERQRKADEAEAKNRHTAAANHRRQADEAAAAARAADEAAEAARKAAEASSADLARTRSVGGSLATLKDSWDFRIDDIEAVKGQKLWALVDRTAKEKAIRAYIRANAPKQLAEGEEWQPIEGVHFFRKSALQTR